MDRSAIIASCSRGWAYNHCKAISESVAGSGYRFQAHLFDISQPRFCQPVNQALPAKTIDDGLIRVKRRKRSRSAIQSQSIVDLEFVLPLEEAALAVIELVRNSRFAGVKWTCDASESACSNCKSKTDAIDFVELSNLAEQFHSCDDFDDIYHLPVGDDVFAQVVCRVVTNSSESCIVINALGARFLIPPHSTFFMSDIKDIGKLMNLGQRYDLIVIDPPWSNKSVKRARNYKALPFQSIKSLPIQSIASFNSIIAVWVTNNQKVIDFVLHELFPTWSLQLIGKWHWIKVTTNGEFIYNFHSTHKKPYECLLIGHHNKHPDNSQSSRTFESFPFHKVICSVPCKLHSRKPMLQEFLGEFLTEDSHFLELFARSLTPGWTSWGNEVLKYQNTCYFHKCGEYVDK